MVVEKIIEVIIFCLFGGLGICVLSAIYGLYLLFSAQGNPRVRQTAIKLGYGGVYSGLFMIILILFFAGFPKV